MKKIKLYDRTPYKKLGDLFGLFFEDINHAADGGLYAELVQNRSFEYDKIDNPSYHSLTAWEKSPDVNWEVSEENGLNTQNVHYLRVETKAGGWICNSGYGAGIFAEAGKQYRFSVYAGCCGEGSLNICVKDGRSGSCCASGSITVSGNDWKYYEITLRAEETTETGRLCISFGQAGVYRLDMVSLFPTDTYKGRKNGLRRDIAEALAQMEPKFMRFPGGCLVHDGSLNDNDRDSMYRWKKTLGPVEERPSRRNNWKYNQTLGLGYYEYFCFCEDIGAEPLPVLPGGFNPHKGVGVPIDELGSWVQDALDLIEFANGTEETHWGAVRAQMGHPEPFGLKYVGIGNEEIGNGFFERYAYFHEAIRKAYPEIKIINTAGPFAMGEGYDAGWTSAKKYGSDLIDEHYYSSPEWFLANMHHYEDYDPSGPKVFLGEYASWGNTYYNALVEAAYMTHLERSRAVGLACYAPMLCHTDYVNWKPDMLWFNNHQILKTPNYYVQKLFMKYQGTDEIPFETEGLDEVLSLAQSDRISGNVMIQGNDVAGRIWNIVLTDEVTGEKRCPADFEVTQENLINELGAMDSEHYSLEFSFHRTAGRKGLKICFGRRDDDNQIVWEFGGWDNWDCNLSTTVNGRSSAISHRIFHVEDKEYRLRLSIDGKKITTCINGEVYNTAFEPTPCLEELYLAASVTGQAKQAESEDCASESEKIIVKAVNLTGEAKQTEIELQRYVEEGKIISLRNHPLDAENTFESPDTVIPETETLSVKNDRFIYEFPPHSVTVIVLK